ncbi:MAG: hypothetical protein WAL35_07175 [Acidimicrobiales bacterium]
MKKTFIILIGALCIVAASATMAAANTTAPRSAARSTMAGATSASSGFAPKCPPFGVVGKALGLTLSGSHFTNEYGTVECYYTSKGTSVPKANIQWLTSQARATFSSDEKFYKSLKTAVPVTNLGTGVTAFGVPSTFLEFLKGTALCTIKAGASVAHLEALAAELLKSYW